MLNKIKQFWTGNKRARELFARLQLAETRLGQAQLKVTELEINFINMQTHATRIDNLNIKLQSENNRLTSLLGKKQAKQRS